MTTNDCGCVEELPRDRMQRVSITSLRTPENAPADCSAAEAAQKQAEAERDTALADKATAEQAKTQAEQERDTAQAEKAQADTAKTQAETERDEALAKLRECEQSKPQCDAESAYSIGDVRLFDAYTCGAEVSSLGGETFGTGVTDVNDTTAGNQEWEDDK